MNTLILNMPSYISKENISVNDVICMVAEINYTKVKLKDGKSLLLAIPLGRYASVLPSNKFCRINKSYLVNISYLEQIIDNKDKKFVQMQDGYQMLISRRKLKNLTSLLEPSILTA